MSTSLHNRLVSCGKCYTKKKHQYSFCQTTVNNCSKRTSLFHHIITSSSPSCVLCFYGVLFTMTRVLLFLGLWIHSGDSFPEKNRSSRIAIAIGIFSIHMHTQTPPSLAEGDYYIFYHANFTNGSLIIRLNNNYSATHIRFFNLRSEQFSLFTNLIILETY